jgi:ESAT-6 family protein
MSASGYILVTPSALAEGAADTDNVASQIDQQLSDLRTYIAPLVATWDGTAAMDYQALQNRWTTNLADLNTVLRQIANALRIAEQNYNSCESTNCSMWS